MSNIAYVSNQKELGVMTSLGMEHIHFDGTLPFDSLIRELKYRQFKIVFVSETIYEVHHRVIDRYNTDLSISIHVIATQHESGAYGKKRLKQLSEDAVGVHR